MTIVERRRLNIHLHTKSTETGSVLAVSIPIIVLVVASLGTWLPVLEADGFDRLTAVRAA